MCSFITQHNATDVASFEGACNWYADCRNVHQRYCCELNAHFCTTVSVHGIVWVSGLLMSMLWIEWPVVAVGLWYGQAYVMDNEHRCILLMAFWMHRDTMIRSWGPLLCHSSTTITSCCSMIMPDISTCKKAFQGGIPKAQPPADPAPPQQKRRPRIWYFTTEHDFTFITKYSWNEQQDWIN